MTLYTAAITLILVMDPMGNVIILLSLLKNVEARRRPWIILRESFIAFVVLMLFVFFGKYILHGLGLSEEALSIAGGIILFLIALKMIFPKQNDESAIAMGEPLVVPLAIPLIAGPSALATVSLLTTQQGVHLPTVIMAVIVASVASAVILLLSGSLRRLLGDRGLIAIERLMGMILTTLAVQMFLTGIASFLK
jgi:multiple antibiotic resistance protein